MNCINVEKLRAPGESIFPCNVGDTVYVFDKGDYEHNYRPYVRPKTVYEISCKQNKYGVYLGWGCLPRAGRLRNGCPLPA